MSFARRGTERRSLRWLAVFAVLGGVCRFVCADEALAPAAPLPAPPSSTESDTPDAPAPSAAETPASPDAPRLVEPEFVQTDAVETAPSPSNRQPRQAPGVHAPALAGPSGGESPDASSFTDRDSVEDDAVETAPPRPSRQPRQAPAVEAPALIGPSGGEQRPGAVGPEAPWWMRVPNVQPFPPLGNTFVPPRGSGYYTLLELLLGDRHDAPPKYPYARFGINAFAFFNTDWRYLDDNDPRDADPFNVLKRIRLGDDFMFTTGGEWRYRYNNEVNSRLSGKNNVYDLTRTRLYVDFWYRDWIRVYAELINAQSFDQNLPPQSIDQYNPNFLNLFVDAKMATVYDQSVYLRGGRQELLYGSERLISPLAWANTQRTFQGAKLFWQNAKLSLDAFCVQPVVPSANGFASVDWPQLFSGVWGTYRPIPGEIIDLYYLDFQDSTRSYSGENGVKGTENVSTVGSRWYGNKNDWLWDTEAMLQFGRYSNQSIMANAYTMGGGYSFGKLPMNPTVWLYYDYASGDPTPGAGGVHRTFDQLFPFGHYYFGMMDNVGRQNINDVHTELIFYPMKWWTVNVQYHVLNLDSPKDALYNSAGVATLVDPTGKDGINVGDILTVINNFTIDLHQNVFVQYSHLYAGSFLHAMGSGSQDELYLMYSFRW